MKSQVALLKERTATTARLQDRVVALGGTLPQPWEWAVIRRFRKRGKAGRGNVTQVDTALYHLQLLELIERLEKAKRKGQAQ